MLCPMVYEQSEIDILQILNVSFIECKFNLDENWDTITDEDYDTEEELIQFPIKIFLFISNIDFVKVNINFIRCYPGNN